MSATTLSVDKQRIEAILNHFEVDKDAIWNVLTDGSLDELVVLVS